MENIVFLGVLAIAMAIASVAPVNAATTTGTLTYKGSIIAVTCDVSVDGAGSDGTVKLPVVSTHELSKSGNTAGRTNFTLDLSNCDFGQEENAYVAAYFQPGATVDSTTGRLRQTDSSGAENVSLQLRDGTTNNVITVGDSSQMNTAGFIEIVPEVSAKIPYSVEYYAEGTTTSGPVSSSVVYNMQYK